MTYDKQFRLNVRLLLDAYIASGAEKSPELVSQRFFGRRNDLNFINLDKPFRVHVYDWIIASFSASWPAGLAWPNHIPRVSLADCRHPISRHKQADEAEA